VTKDKQTPRIYSDHQRIDARSLAMHRLIARSPCSFFRMASATEGGLKADYAKCADSGQDVVIHSWYNDAPMGLRQE
jgi:hypothetical protein